MVLHTLWEGGGGGAQGQYCFQNYFQDTVCLFHCVEICLRGATVMVTETAGSLAGLKAVAGKGTSLVIILFIAMLSKYKQTRTVSLKNGLNNPPNAP